MASMKSSVWMLILFVFLTSLAHGSTGQARKDYEKGDYQSALEEYLRLEQETPDDARLDFNAGAAAFRGGEFERAVDLFKESLKTTDLELQQKGYYNNGNALYRLGEDQMSLSPQLTMDRWEEAIKEYENALELNPDDEDAEYNKDLVERKLMALKRRLQQQGRQQGNQQQQPNQNGQGGSGQQNQQSGEGSQQQQPQNQNGDDQGRQEQEDSQQGSGDQQQAPQQPGPQPEPVPQDQPGSQGGQDPVPEKLTPEQARQLLENHLGEEKAMLFLPRNRTNTYRAPEKDW